MKVLFLTLVEINDINDRGIYQDLLRKFEHEGHEITIVTPIERRKKTGTNFKKKDGVNYLQVKTLNIQKTNKIEKGLGVLLLEQQYLRAIKKYLTAVKFDLVLYSTPPITFYKVIQYIKNRDQAYTYLLLKDIFPQNAVDMKMIKQGGFIHKAFLKKEKQLYAISDTIGCMSPANVDFILRHNADIKAGKVEENPNTIEPLTFAYAPDEQKAIRKKYAIPLHKKVFVYGGNLGKPQGLDFLLATISATKNENAFFLIVGDGTEFGKIETWFQQNAPNNAKLLQRLPKEDYDQLLSSCDIGLIFLDKNFLIPNFPSRLLSYLEMQMPILVASDPNTDMGDIVEEAKCGYKVLAGNQDEMQDKINRLLIADDLKSMGINALNLLNNSYLVGRSYDLIYGKLSNV